MKKSKNPLIRILGNKKWQFITIPVFAFLCSIIAITLIILLIGKNPGVAFHSLLQGSGILPKPKYAAHKGIITDFLEMLDMLTPMIFAALAVAVAFRAGLFNIGVSGQMLAAGFLTTITIGYSSLNAGLAKPLCLIMGAAVGALAGCLIGFLKYKFNINEVVSSIMLNYIFQYIISYFINTRYVDPVSRQSRDVSATARLTLQNVSAGDYKMKLPICIIIAVFAAVFVWFFFKKTRQGYEFHAVGRNVTASKYAGIKVGKTIVLAMTFSGALAGLSGVTYYMGYFSSIQPNTLASTGFDSIAVSLLGNSHPIGILASSFLITVLSKGSTYMSSTAGVRYEVASLIIGMILLFSACGAYIRNTVDRYTKEKGAENGNNNN
ncbi:MAG: ABC transporter permease [Lachnospiraceae bacterium]|jgi:simple sugar transport system permease protein|nr:ABC transporter permease [Lachnospiraceae bacterium]